MSGTSIQSDWVGRVIDGRFSLLQWLGNGERSAAFLTELPGTQGKKAAIKLSPDDGTDSEETIAGWAAARPLSHPNLMRLIHAGRCESEGTAVLYEVAEYADEVLSEILPERALTPEEAKQMLAPVLDALAYLHSKGLVHGHLKPENVLVVNDRLKISGDRLRAAGETGKQTAALSIHEAPERGNGTVSAAGDVWSLGVLLVETLTQHPPVWDKTTGGDPMVPQSIPEPYYGIARACLKVEPSSRCTVESVKTWIETGLPDSGAAENDRKKQFGKFGVTALVAAVVVVGAAVAVVEMRSKGTHETPQVAPGQTDTQPMAADKATAPQPPDHPDDTVPTTQHQAEASPMAVEKPSPSVAAAPAQQAPASETHASKPILMQDVPVNGVVAQQVMPEYLPKALDSIHGKFVVKVRVTVDAAGNVTNAVYESEGPSGYFAKSALEAAKKWKFKPSPSGGTSKWIVQFLFTHDGPQMTTTAAQ